MKNLSTRYKRVLVTNLPGKIQVQRVCIRGESVNIAAAVLNLCKRSISTSRVIKKKFISDHKMQIHTTIEFASKNGTILTCIGGVRGECID